MKIISQAITMSVTAGVVATLFVSQASAGCGSMTNWQGPFTMAQPSAAIRPVPQATGAAKASASATMTGLWKVQFLSLGNLNHNPSIPDGALIDFGYNQFHSDGTEMLNSGGHAPATENFCMGVWGKTGFLAYEVNHFALSYDPISGALAANVNIREQITLSPSGDMYTGTFTIDIYDPSGNHIDHVAGTLTAQRLTLDSTLP